MTGASTNQPAEPGRAQRVRCTAAIVALSRESIARLTGRPATLHSDRLTIELDNGKRHTIEGLSHPPTPQARYIVARMTLNAANTLVIGLKRQP